MNRREFITLLGGAAAGCPFAARAQHRTGKTPRVGFLLNVPSELVDTLFRGLREVGYLEGHNVVLETRFVGNMLDRIDQFATELVALHCDLIFAAGPYAIQALTKATSTIPVIAIDLESDPVANRWAASIARPGGNLTGFFLDLPELDGKQIELLKEALPSLSRVAFLWDSTVGLVQFSATEMVAHTAGVEPLSLPIQRREDLRLPLIMRTASKPMRWWSCLRLSYLGSDPTSPNWPCTLVCRRSAYSRSFLDPAG
jgi:putative tryptophan/tyrosine transport system substrate-binding protein